MVVGVRELTAPWWLCPCCVTRCQLQQPFLYELHWVGFFVCCTFQVVFVSCVSHPRTFVS